MPDKAHHARPRHSLEPLLGRLATPEETSALVLSVGAPRTQLNLRGNGQDERFVAAVSEALGQSLPVAPNTFSSGAYRLYWLGPNEWLVCSDVEDAVTLLTTLRNALSGQACAVTDVSAGQVAMQLCGEAARHVLARGCTLDFDPSVFRVGDCAQSGLAKSTALIALQDDSPRFDIFVRRSFADYVVRWLHHAGREYGLKVQEMPID